jgi:hypothetical protein
MIILTAEEAEGLQPLGKGKFTWLYKQLVLLQVGEAIVIPYGDWKTKEPPYRTIRTAAKNLTRTFDYGHHPDGNGWMVKRMA